MRLKLGPSSQREQRRTHRARDGLCVCVSVFLHTWAHIRVLSVLSVHLYVHLNMHFVGASIDAFTDAFTDGAECDMKSVSSSASGSVPHWIQKAVLWHGPFTSRPACSIIYLCMLWSRAVCTRFGFLAAFALLHLRERDFLHPMMALLWQQDTCHQWMCTDVWYVC